MKIKYNENNSDKVIKITQDNLYLSDFNGFALNFIPELHILWLRALLFATVNCIMTMAISDSDSARSQYELNGKQICEMLR